MENAIKNIFAREALHSRAKLFAMSGGLPVGKRTVRQGLKPLAMRPKIIVPNGGQQDHREFQSTNTTTEPTAEYKLLVKAEVAYTMARRETALLSARLYGGHPYNAPFENVATEFGYRELTAEKRLLVQAEVKETLARRKADVPHAAVMRSSRPWLERSPL